MLNFVESLHSVSEKIIKRLKIQIQFFFIFQQSSAVKEATIMTYLNQMILVLDAAVSARILLHCEPSYNVASMTQIECNPYHKLNKNKVEWQYEFAYVFENSTDRRICLHIRDKRTVSLQYAFDCELPMHKHSLQHNRNPNSKTVRHLASELQVFPVPIAVSTVRGL